jgi:hypothetical protein
VQPATFPTVSTVCGLAGPTPKLFGFTHLQRLDFGSVRFFRCLLCAKKVELVGISPKQVLLNEAFEVPKESVHVK